VSLFGEATALHRHTRLPSRFLPHSCIYVNADANIRTPKDLIGKRIGTPEYQMNCAGLSVASCPALRCSSRQRHLPHRREEEEPGRPEKIRLTCAAHQRCSRSARHRRLSRCSRSGEIDALYTARMPSTFSLRRGAVATAICKLQGSRAGVTTAKTRIFPIMHTVRESAADVYRGRIAIGWNIAQSH